MRRNQVYTMIDRAAGWLLPPRCVLCRGPGQAPSFDLCLSCEAELPRVPRPCHRCGMPGPAGQAGRVRGERCARCESIELPYQRCFAPWSYEFPVTRLVHALKYQGALATARVFGMQIAAAGGGAMEPNSAATLIVPMPLHPRRLVERGFNQSREIARVVARMVDRPLVESALRRVRETAHQVGLSRQERLGNLRGAFMANALIVAGQRVILVDDVVTTGSTAAEAATALVAAGATHVEVWAAARALG